MRPDGGRVVGTMIIFTPFFSLSLCHSSSLYHSIRNLLVIISQVISSSHLKIFEITREGEREETKRVESERRKKCSESE